MGRDRPRFPVQLVRFATQVAADRGRTVVRWRPGCGRAARRSLARADGRSQASWWGRLTPVVTLILIGFLGGLVTGISPCILPVVPVIFAAGAASGLPRTRWRMTTPVADDRAEVGGVAAEVAGPP